MPDSTETKTMEAGRELDALVAERVMGESLTVPREKAMAEVGWRYVRETGHTFGLTVAGRRMSLPMPRWEDLPGHESDDNLNDRYTRHVCEYLLTLGGEIAAEVEASVSAYRLTPESYSTDIAEAWLIVEKFRRTTEDDETFVNVIDCGAQGWLCTIEENVNPSDAAARIGEGIADTAALAICRAALAAVEGR